MAKFINNSIDNTIGGSNSGLTNTLTVENTSNTASSAARETITVGGGTAADPTLNFNVNGVTDWEMGIDNSVSDNLTISQSATLGTKDVWRMNVSGQRTMPLQPCFLAYLGASVNNVTGDGTFFSIICDQVKYDQASNYNAGTGTFTAPVTGKYQFNYGIRVSNIGPANTTYVNALNTTLARWRGTQSNTIHDFGDLFATTSSICVNMNAGDTAVIQVDIAGGAKTIGVDGGPGTDNSTWFSGFLVC